MREQYEESSLALKRSFIAQRVHEDDIQTAMAIALLPAEEGLLPHEFGRLTQTHRLRYHRRELPNPMKDHQPDMLGQLYKVIYSIDGYIQDYVFKATSSSLPHACLLLPDFAHHSYTRVSKIACAGNPGVGFDALRPTEIQGLFRSFLEYELTCRANPIRPIQGRSYPWWSVHSIWSRSPQRDLTVDRMQCVHEYYRTIVGAVIARLVDGGMQLPPLPHSSRSFDDEPDVPGIPHGLVFPDDVQFNPDLYMTGLDPGARRNLVDCLAACGTKVIQNLIETSVDEAKILIERFHNELAETPPEAIPHSSCLPPPDMVLKEDDREDGAWAKLKYSFHRNRGNSFLGSAYIRMYRQRAWAFFEDVRFYEDECALCTFEEFKYRELDAESMLGNLVDARVEGRGAWSTIRLGTLRIFDLNKIPVKNHGYSALDYMRLPKNDGDDDMHQEVLEVGDDEYYL
ncbi:hypothetical protein FDECE_2057 [Fusarium decemcellulare]|nr:hypothetical protein FDECE_2057 [Fusarium decemcellulare]